MKIIVIIECTKDGKAILLLIKKLSSVEIMYEPNEVTKNAIEDTRHKKGTKGRNKADFFAKLKS